MGALPSKLGYRTTSEEAGLDNTGECLVRCQTVWHKMHKQELWGRPSRASWTRQNSMKTLKDGEQFGKEKDQGPPWWSVAKSPPANAGDMGLIPGPGRSHVPELPKPELLEPVLHKRSPRSGKPAPHIWRGAQLAATRERPCEGTKTQRSQK